MTKRARAQWSSGLVVVAGHAIYQHGVWHGLAVPGDEPIVEQHVARGFSLARRLRARAVVLSGGHTRPALAAVKDGCVTFSEADGMLAFASEHGLDPGGAAVILERFARDSFENLFFSLLAFHARFGVWPSMLGIVTWKFKALRLYLAAAGLRLDERFVFFGSGDIRHLAACASELRNSVLLVDDPAGTVRDPLHRGSEFKDKRAQRTPQGRAASYHRAVANAYGEGAAALLERVEGLSPDADWRSIDWPWLASARRTAGDIVTGD